MQKVLPYKKIHFTKCRRCYHIRKYILQNADFYGFTMDSACRRIVPFQLWHACPKFYLHRTEYYYSIPEGYNNLFHLDCQWK